MPRQDVCLSVPPSVTRRYSVQTVRHIVNVFLPTGSPTILVFFASNGMAMFRWETPNGASNAWGYEKNHDIISLYLGNDARYGTSLNDLE